MTVEEMGKVIDYIKTCYPQAWKDVDVKKTVAVWAGMFADDNKHDVMMAVKAYVASDTTGFAPSIGQVKSEMIRVQLQGAPSANDAWTHIRKAISNSAYYSESEFRALTPAEQRIVGSPRQLFDWSQMDVDTLDSVVASNVRRAYQSLADSERYRMTLPAKLLAQLSEFEGRLIGE